MTQRYGALFFAVLFCRAYAVSQEAPPSPDRPWHSQWEQQLSRVGKFPDAPEFSINPSTNYSLGELIDLAETHNPETRLAWERARAQAATLGLARSELYPALAATAVSQFTRGTAFFGENFYRQKIGELQGNLELSYTVFDFGARAGRINAAKAELLAANFAFNDAHRRVIYQVEQAYYEEEVNRSKQRKRRLFRGRRRTAPTRTLLSELPMSLKSSSWLQPKVSVLSVISCSTGLLAEGFRREFRF